MRKRLGQHFLKDKSSIKRTVEALCLEEGDVVIEIGTGHGELTAELDGGNEKGQIIGIEKDNQLFEFARKRFAGKKSIKIIEGDALEVLPSLIEGPESKIREYKLTGNIPYYLTGYLFRTIGELKNRPRICVFTIQKEVAERVAAKPPKMNKLSASVQFWAEPEIIKFLPKEIFSPPPKVDSAIIRLRVVTLDRRSSDRCNESRYYEAVRVLFKQPRKTILNNLLAGGLKKDLILFTLKRAGVSPGDRSQNLDVPKIKELARKIVS